MPVHVKCPRCAITLNVPDQMVGQNVCCQKCDQIFQAGGAAPAPGRW